MASTFAPYIETFIAGGSISKGHAVKFDSTENQVVKCALSTDKAIGLAQGDASSGGAVEVALLGGAKALAGGAINPGDFLASDTNGALVATTSANDKVVAQAMNTAATNDLVSVMVRCFNY